MDDSNVVKRKKGVDGKVIEVPKGLQTPVKLKPWKTYVSSLIQYKTLLINCLSAVSATCLGCLVANLINR